MKKLLALALILAMSVSMLAGCGGTPPTSSAAPIPSSAAPTPTSGDPSKAAEPAAPELPETGKLTLYAAALEDECVAIGKAFEEKSGIKTNVVVLGGGEVFARVQAEASNATASVWWGGGCDGPMNAKEKGLLAQYVSPSAADISAQCKDSEGYWTGVYTGYLGFVCNTKRLKELGIAAPASWDDLLKPELKGEIIFAAPDASSTGYNVLAAIVNLMGEEKGMEYMKKLNGQMASYTERGTGWIAPVTTGESVVGLCYLQDAVDLMVNEGYANVLTLSTAAEGTGYEMGAVCILKDGPDQASARKFVDWCLTPEAQNINQKYGHYVFLTNPKATAPKEVSFLANTKLIKQDFLWNAAHKADLIEKWQKATGHNA